MYRTIFFIAITLISISSYAAGQLSLLKDHFIPQALRVTQTLGWPLETRHEFENSMDYLFDVKIKPLVEELDLLAGKHENKIDSLIQQRLEQIKIILNTTVQQLSSEGQEAIDHAYRALDSLQTNLHHDLLEIIDKIECTEDKTKIDIESQMDRIKILFTFSNPSCFQDLGIVDYPKSSEYLMNYELIKCEKIKTLSPKTPLVTLYSTYGDLGNLAWRVACIQRHTHSPMNHLIDDWFEMGRKYTFWYQLSQRNF